MSLQRIHNLLVLIPFLLLVSCGGTEKDIEVASIALSQPSAEMEIGETLSLKATVSPSNAAYDGITWTSTKPKVASVSESGLVTAISEGNTTITVMAGGKTASCSVTVVKGFVAITSIKLNKTSLEMIEGDTETLTVSISPDDATDKTITWTSSKESVATVNNGVISAVSPGETTISAKAGDKTATCKVTVQKKVIAVTSIELSKVALSLVEGESEALTATVKPENATDKTVSWKSSNNNIATVSENGTVTAIKEGEATITASAGEKTASCTVTVKQKPLVSSLTLSENSFNGYINNYYSISVTISPSNAQYNLEWNSSNTRVAEVQGSGLSRNIFTKDFGETEISVKDKISGKSASIIVKTVVTEFEWKENTGSTYAGYPLITITEGDEYQLHYSCSPSSATHLFEDFSNLVFYEPTYVVDNPSVISISSEGKVTGLKPGTIGIKPTGRIIKKSSSGNERIYITVKAKTIAVSEVRLNKSSLSLNVGESETLTAIVIPDNATNKTVTWKSSNNSIATVDSNGKVKAVAAGSAIITATADGISSTCSVTVTVPVSSVTLNKSELKLVKGKDETLIATINPSNATNKTVVWSSNNPSIATVDQNGKVSGITEGNAQITVTTNDGAKKATCTVTVLPPGNTEIIDDDGQYHGWD